MINISLYVIIIKITSSFGFGYQGVAKILYIFRVVGVGSNNLFAHEQSELDSIEKKLKQIKKRLKYSKLKNETEKQGKAEWYRLNDLANAASACSSNACVCARA